MTMFIPDAFRQRYCPMVDDEDAFLACLEVLLPRSFRVNTIKSVAADVKKRFSGYGIPIKQMEWYEDAFISENPDIGGTLEHFTGAIYMQELVSMLPPLLLREELKDARFVLDACAAPGSKTTQLAAMMGNRGVVVANDSSYSRTKALKFNLEKTGAINAIITNQDLRNFPHMQFDAILLDAPCSAEGTIRKNDKLFAEWSQKSIYSQSRLQKQLITKAFELLAPGGAMVYSTCTFAPEENEAVVDWLLQNHPEAVIEPIPEMEGLKLSQPLEEWDGKAFDGWVSKTRRIWPHHSNTGGFYLAKVRK